MLSEVFGRWILIAVALLAVATQALAQTRPIRGKVTDEQGRPVAGAVIEVTQVSAAIVGFVTPGQQRAGGQTWQTKTNENGDYMVVVSTSGAYLVSASLAGVGADQTEIVVQFDGITNVNLRLWKAARARVSGVDCAKSTATKAFDANMAASNASHPELARLLRWLEAVQLHTPGCGDSAVVEVARWSLSDFETVLADLINLSAFLQWVREKPSELSAEARSSIESLTGGTRRHSEARFVRDPHRVAAILIYNRRFDLEEIEQIFHGNDTLRRGAVLHTDIAVFVPGDFNQYFVVDDGRRKGGRPGTLHWHLGRQLLDTITPSPSGDADALLWYRAVSAYLFREGHLAEAAQHLDRARQVFTDHPLVLLDSAYLHQELSSPAIQTAVQEVRAEGASVAVDSRRNELQLAERFLRQTLALTRDAGEARLRLGHTLGELGRHDEAVAELRTAIEADLDTERLYLAQLFLGRAEQALGQRDEARRRYEQAADLYPSAQSPRLALAQLARESGDRVGALRALQNVVARPSADVDVNDPWWFYYYPHLKDAAELMEEMRTIGSAEAR
jgi:hypothetical protein